MRLLLDTQILIWLAGNRKLLRPGERSAIAQADDLLVSTLSLMELRMKRRAERRRGQTPTVLSPADAIAFCSGRRIGLEQIKPVDLTTDLFDDPPHGDPFDEMLLVHALTLQARFLTRDDKLLGHPLAYRSS